LGNICYFLIVVINRKIYNSLKFLILTCQTTEAYSKRTLLIAGVIVENGI